MTDSATRLPPVEPVAVASLSDLMRRYDFGLLAFEDSYGNTWLEARNVVWYQYAWRAERVVRAIVRSPQTLPEALLQELRTHRYVVIKRRWWRRKVELDLERTNLIP